MHPLASLPHWLLAPEQIFWSRHWLGRASVPMAFSGLIWAGELITGGIIVILVNPNQWLLMSQVGGDRTERGGRGELAKNKWERKTRRSRVKIKTWGGWSEGSMGQFLYIVLFLHLKYTLSALHWTYYSFMVGNYMCSHSCANLHKRPLRPPPNNHSH